MSWILFGSFILASYFSLMFSFNQFGIFYTLRSNLINQTIFNQYVIHYLLKAYWAWCPGSCVWRWPPPPRWSLPLSSPQLLSWSGSSHAPPGHNWGEGGEGPLLESILKIFWVQCFFHFDLFMGIFIIGCLLLMITLVSTWYASCTSWSFCIWPVRPGNSLSWANITLRALEF